MIAGRQVTQHGTHPSANARRALCLRGAEGLTLPLGPALLCLALFDLLFGELLNAGEHLAEPLPHAIAVAVCVGPDIAAAAPLRRIRGDAQAQRGHRAGYRPAGTVMGGVAGRRWWGGPLEGDVRVRGRTGRWPATCRVGG